MLLRFFSLSFILLSTNVAFANGGSDLDPPTMPAVNSYKRYQTKTTVTSTALGMVVGKGVFYNCVDNQPKAPFSYEYNSGPETKVNTSTTYSSHSYSAATAEGATAKCDIDVEARKKADAVLKKHQNWYIDGVFLENFLGSLAEELIENGQKYPGSGTVNNLFSWSPFNDYRSCANQADQTLLKVCSVNDLKETYHFKVIKKGLGGTVGYPNAPLLWHHFVAIYTSETWGPIYILDSWNSKRGEFVSLSGADKAKFRNQYLTE